MLDKISNSPFWKSLWESSAKMVPDAARRYPETQSVLVPMLKALTATVDNAFILSSFLDDTATTSVASPSTDILHHLITILRQIPLRRLYVFSGWQASEIESKAAGDYLQSWMRRDSSTTRMCLWHAVAIFRTLRSKVHITCYEPFALLIAALFIRGFDLLARPNDDPVAQDDGWTGEMPPTRVDQLYRAQDVEQWAEEGRNDRVHVTGIGILRGPASAQRLMVEARRILLSQAGWLKLRLGLAYALEQSIHGRRPCRREESTTQGGDRRLGRYFRH